ncbi:unnamed protein product [Cylindrotheca closterium]|uniref:Uncharacterized protein n=1 Tax=Cylindrotheca closterium TaxID=2856 RepID=A0AAD2G4V6_9STRA|nr:unnamed protein product [Cylindrotheca closterium]
MPPAADAPTWEEMEKTNAAMETARDALAALSISDHHLCGVDEQFQDILRDNEMKEAVKVLLGHNAKKLPGLSYEAPRDAVNMLGGAPSEELTVPSVDSPESVPNFKAPADLTEIEIVVKYRIKKEQMLHRIYIKRLATW